MALLWALEFGSKEDWNLANLIISQISKKIIFNTLSKWQSYAENGETEGYLVHLFLLRHGKIPNSSLGSIIELFERVKKDYPLIPDEMKNIVTCFDIDEND